MTMRVRQFRVLPWAAGCLLVAGIVHLSTILMIPRFAERDAYAALGGSTGGMTLLPSWSERQSIPFQDPAAAMANCRFDLDQGPSRVRYVAGETLVTLSFHDRTGRIFYSTTDRAGLRGRVDVLLLDAQQLDTLEATDPEDQAPQELRLVPPTRTGFVLVRSVAERPSAVPAALAAAQAVLCRIER